MKPFSHPAFRARFGVAQRATTPPVGIHARSWGAATHDIAEGIHRPFALTALTIQPEEDPEPLALVAMDLGWAQTEIEIGRLVSAAEAGGIPSGRALVSLSHTHSGPAFSPALADKPGGHLIAPYLDELCEKLRDAVACALETARPGVWEAGTGYCGLASNRDLPEPGSERWVVGWNPEGIADGTLLVGRISDLLGKPMATIVNYACHPTILAWENRLLSPEYIGAMRDLIQEETGAPCLFLQGASGELAAREQYVADVAVADRAGRALGHAALSVLSTMNSPCQELAYSGVVESGAPLAIWKSRSRTSFPSGVRILERTITHDIRGDLPSEEALRSQIADCRDRVLLERLQRALRQRLALGGDGTTQIQRHAIWRLGDLFVVSVPKEAYSGLQVVLRKAVAPLPVFIPTLTNGTSGYLAPTSSYKADSYESSASPYAEGCFEHTVAFLESEIQKLL